MGIIQTAHEKSYDAAAREHSGITPDGKKVSLSVQHIKDFESTVVAFWITFSHYFPRYIMGMKTISTMVSNDDELGEIYKKLQMEYNDKEEKMEQEQQQQLQQEEGKQLLSSRQKNEAGFYEYQYECFTVRHNPCDHQTYQRQKLPQYDDNNGKKKPRHDRRIEHMVKESDLPPEVVEKLRRSRKK